MASGPVFDHFVEVGAAVASGPVFDHASEGLPGIAAGPIFDHLTTLPPPPSFSGLSGGSVPVVEPIQTFSAPSEGRTVVKIRDYSITTFGRVAFPPTQTFGALVDGIADGIPTPLSLTATVVDAGCIRLDWIDPSTKEDGFRLERSLEDANDWEIIATLPADTIIFLDRFAIPLVIYDYRVIGFDDFGVQSRPSNIATAVTPLPPDLTVLPPLTSSLNPTRNKLVTPPVEAKSPGVL